MENEEAINRIPPANDRGGVWVQIGMEEYRIPPLGFGAIRELEESLPLLNGMSGFPTEQQMDVVAKIIHLAMKRNYPDMTQQQVFDCLDLGNYRAIFDAVMALSGYKAAGPGEPIPTSP